MIMQRLNVTKEAVADAMGIDVGEFNHYLYGILSPEGTVKVLDALVKLEYKTPEKDDLGNQMSLEDGLLRMIMYYESVLCSEATFTMDEHIKVFSWLWELAMYRGIGLISEVVKASEINYETVD